ncbi:MAG: asparagine synthase (glutamine-hydrolyzing) [Sandaracinaceae bacterium]|nr:asparagine synthase (glutamine-hydrolyzing) [Myxococcales bacterium]
MCGIAGIWDPSVAPDECRARVAAMSDAVRHRGPDDHGVWLDEAAGLGLGQRRLSIIDLSEAGHQPMVSASGRYVVTYNGEIYNFRRLRDELLPLGHRFRGESDTEVLLAAVEEWGPRGAAERSVGMFAFALWDREERKLHLVRDRLGVKPLVYGRLGGAFFFASELHAVRTDARLRAALDIDRGSLAMLAQFSFVPDPGTVYQHVHKLLPGTILTIGAHDESPPAPLPYWSIEEAVVEGRRHGAISSAEEAVAELDELLRDSIELRMISDVPLGAFLSGGIDSSAVVAIMQSLSARPVKTFTVGYSEGDYDEAGDARRVAKHLGTDHHELQLSAGDVMSVIERLPQIYDEPFADSSQLPTTLISEFARRHVTVVLTGDGGDEVFAGYNRHVWGRRAWRMLQVLPRRLRRSMSAALNSVSVDTWDRAVGAADGLLPPRFRMRSPGDKMAKLARLLDAGTAREMYVDLVSHWREPSSVVPRAGLVRTPVDRMLDQIPTGLDFAEIAALVDTKVFLPGDILVKVDRASMSVGLEAREPLLDHRLVEYAWRLPLSLKHRGGVGKWVLRELLARYVPRAMFERPKMGFGVPIHTWLRGELRPWAEELLSDQSLRDAGIFDPTLVRRKWKEHQSGVRNAHSELWSVLMVQAWLRAQVR